MQHFELKNTHSLLKGKLQQDSSPLCFVDDVGGKLRWKGLQVRVYMRVCAQHVGWFPVPTQQRGSLAFLCAYIKGHGEPPILRLDFTSCHPGLVLIKALLFLWEHHHMFHTCPLSPTTEPKENFTHQTLNRAHTQARTLHQKSLYCDGLSSPHLHINTRWSCFAGALRSPVHTMRKSTHRS